MSDWDIERLYAVAQALNDDHTASQSQPAEWVVRHDELQAEAEEQAR